MFVFTARKLKTSKIFQQGRKNNFKLEFKIVVLPNQFSRHSCFIKNH